LPLDLRAPSADRCETLRCDQYLGHFISQVQKFKGFGAKNMQNLGRFYATSYFDHEYAQNEMLSEIGKICDPERFLPRSAKEVW